MKKIHSVLVALLIGTLIVPLPVRAESLSDNYTSIAPMQASGTGEFVHGQKSGKILIRLLMFGAVPTQGIHYVPEGTDLLFAILYSGGFTENSKLNGISIRRRNVKNLMEIDLEDMIESGSPVPKMMDGDVVTVPYNWRRDINTISLITGFISSMTAFTLSLVALAK